MKLKPRSPNQIAHHAHKIASCGQPLDLTGLRLCDLGPGEMAFLANDPELQSGGFRFNFLEAYPNGPSFEHREEFVHRGGQVFKVIRVKPVVRLRES